MRQLIISLFTAFAIAALMSAAFAQERIEISFPIVETQESEARELEKKRRLSGRYWCDPVDFDTTAILDLAKKIQSGDVGVQSTAVRIEIRSESLDYLGESSQVVETAEGDKLAVWIGRLAGAQGFRAAFVVAPNLGHTFARIDSDKGTFRLDTFASQRIFVICEYDPTRLGRKID